MQKTLKLDAALEWFRRGCSVIPIHFIRTNGGCSCFEAMDCANKGKHPAVYWSQFQNRRASLDTLESWFEIGGKYEKHNLGVVTGSISGNLGVLDVDVGIDKEGGETLFDLQLQHGELERTLEQHTGGGGIHFFHLAPEGMELVTDSNVLGPGVDYRGEGGFVVVAPSNHKSGNLYKLREGCTDLPQEMPSWLLSMVTQTAANEGHSEQPAIINRWGELVDGREGYVISLLIGCIATAYRDSGKILSVQELVEEAWPVFGKKCAARGVSLESDGRGVAFMTKKAEYLVRRAESGHLRILQKIQPGTESKVHLAAETFAAEPLLDLPKIEHQPLKLSDHWLTNYLGDPPEQEWLVENRIPLGISGLVAGQGGVGKSFTLLDFALKVAGGDQGMHLEKAFGSPILKNGLAVYITAEDSKDVLHRRIASLQDPTIRERAKDRLIVVPLPDLGGPASFISSEMGVFGPTQAYLDIRAQLIELDKEHNVVLVIIDPLQPFTSADINADPAAAQYWWSLMNELCAKIRATVLVSHHMRKEGAWSIKKASEARQAIRGTSALVDGCRLAIALWAIPEGEEYILAQKLGFETGIGAAVNMAIVKTNDLADMSPISCIRAENGLLVDRTPEIMEILDDSASLDSQQVSTIFSVVRSRWTEDNPFSSAANTPRSLISFLKSEYMLSHYAAKNYQQIWLNRGELEDVVFSSHSKMRGIRVKHLGETHGNIN